MKPSEILDAAANIILRDGWHQGTYFAFEPHDPREVCEEKNRTAPCCQAGAISRAAFGVALREGGLKEATDARVLAFSRASHYMLWHVQQTYNVTPIEWNDRPTTTKDDIVTALRGAADDARRAGE
ncbi:DUF6197 family protein [Streptomyces sp. S1]|uniref:DUF6197 family protein n=1 Tax=Streptomyces sp. S1 TaxID=718288 RepID=UPI003D74744F